MSSAASSRTMFGMYERRHQPLAPRAHYLSRLRRSLAVFSLMVGGSLAVGTLGYWAIGDLQWIDALLNAAMILTGMGPVDRMTTSGGKLFAAAYALFSGVAFLSSVGILAAPVVHRFLHRFHIAEGKAAEAS